MYIYVYSLIGMFLGIFFKTSSVLMGPFSGHILMVFCLQSGIYVVCTS